MIQLRIRKVGESLGLTLPADVTRVLRVKEGDQILLTEAPGGCFRITPCNPDFVDAMKAAGAFMTRFRHAVRELAK